MIDFPDDDDAPQIICIHHSRGWRSQSQSQSQSQLEVTVQIGNEYVFADSDSESIDPCDQNYPFM